MRSDFGFRVLDFGKGHPLLPRRDPLGRRSTHSPSAIRHLHGGLTLVELLVAMAILVTVSASAALIFRGISRAWRTGTLRTERYQQARLLFDLFERELSSSVANARYLLIGTEPSEGPRLREGSAFAELFFVGTLPGRAGLVERGYWVNAEGDLVCHDDEPADGDYVTGSAELCGRDIAQFSVAYFDGTNWLDRWNAGTAPDREGELPKAIYIALTVGHQQSERFETVIYVPTS